MKTQINGLTATRAIAAILVVIHHFGYQIYPFSLLPSVFHHGNIAISYFFVLSGFVLYYSYANATISYFDYFRKRMARIVPVYWLALALFIVVAFSFYHYTFSKDFLKQVAYNACFIQAYFSNYALSLNSPAWTISVEMLFYVLFPLLLTFQTKTPVAFVAATVAIFIMSQYIHISHYTPGIEQSKQSEGASFYNPFIHLSQFLMGMVSGYFFSLLRLRGIKLFYGLPTLLFLLIIVLMVCKPASISYHTGLLDPIFGCIIVAIALRETAVLKMKWLVFLGDASYGIYILQWPVFKLMSAINDRYTHLPYPVYFVLALVVLLFVASISFLYFEKPMRRKINSIHLSGK